MPYPAPAKRSLLRRRDSVSTAVRALLDGLAVIVTSWFAVTTYHNGVFSERYAVLLLVLLGAMALAYNRMDVYGTHARFANQTIALINAWVVAFGVLLTIAFLTKQTEAYSRFVLIVVFFGGLAAQGAIHFAFRLLHRVLKARVDAEKTLLVGTGPLADQLYFGIQDNPWIGERIVGAVSLEPAATPAPGRIPVLGTLADAPRLVDELGVRTVYLVTNLDAVPTIQALYFALLDRNVNVHWVPNIFALNLINHSVGELAGLPIITLSETPLVGTRRLAKDVEDKLLGSLLLLVASPLMLLAALAIKLDSPGPVFFRQPRTGWDGKVFWIWKFRSMRVEAAEAVGQMRQATYDDPRVTRVGRLLRRTSIDELPQLFNVLAGNMSLVGPRPHAVAHNLHYAGQITAYLGRHRVKPGITGLAQVRGFRGETQDLALMERRVQADLEYINHWSVWLDLTILLRTLFALTGEHAY